MTAWNRARLGAGRTAIRSIAFFSRRALVFAYSDAGCGIAFPPDAVAGSQSEGLFIAVLDGAYAGIDAPVSGYGSAHPAPNAAAFGELAASDTNVRVDPLTGRLAVIPGGQMPVVAYTILDAGVPCRIIVAPPGSVTVPQAYDLIRATASCAWVRTVIFAYVTGEGSRLPGPATKPPARLIDGWRCRASGRPAPVTGRDIRRFRLTCTRAGQMIVARGHVTRVIRPHARA